jgi:hypothetical protein
MSRSRSRSGRSSRLVGALLFVTAALAAVPARAAGPTGAIFTTTPDGSIVNENVRYEMKIEVYLDGGPGPNAPQTAAGLDDGWYVFQITDPSGARLLSMDPSKCRVLEVEAGVVTRLVPPSDFGLTNTYLVGSKTYPCHVQDSPDGEAGASGRHDTNVDLDHGPPAIVVQMMPFGDTPNPGGVYKAWAEKYDTYLAKGGDLSYVPVALKGAQAKACPNFCAERDPGFGPPNTDTKTDNFKVKKPGKPPVPPEITVKKFHDRDADGVFDSGDEWVTGWQVDVTDPLGVTNPVFTAATILAEPAGLWTFLEETPEGTVQTASYVDGLGTSPFPRNPVTVMVAGTSEEKHEVVFGDVGLGAVKACKVYDRDADGEADEGEPLIAGWKIVLEGVLASGVVYGPVTQTTGEDGCTTFGDLLPGAYTVSEVMPPGWYTALEFPFFDFQIESTLSGSVMQGGTYEFDFPNFCTGEADFDTKGYWHNKNGLSELDVDDRDYANGLDPYDAPSDYFSAGDEPFDGLFQNGDPVAAAFNNDDNSLIWGAGTWQAEISHSLVDANATGGGGDREQLAQQLLAFIFNTRHRLDGPEAVIFEPTLGWVSAADVIDAAIAAWASPTTDDDKVWEPILDGLNNDDDVPFIHWYPCEVVYY